MRLVVAALAAFFMRSRLIVASALVVATAFGAALIGGGQAASLGSYSYDPPPETGTVTYDAAAVDVPFSVNPPQTCVDPPPVSGTVGNVDVNLNVQETCVDPPEVSGTVSFNAPPVDVPYTHDPAPRDIAIPDPPADCGDGLDNDADGLIDAPNDPGCTSTADTLEAPDQAPAPKAECENGLDDDADGKTDYPADPGCTGAADDDETDPAPPPPPPPAGEVAPARATTVDCNGGSYAATSVKNDTRYIDCAFSGDMNAAMNGKQRITIIGSQFPVTQLRGVTDVWIEGRPDAYMNAGPRTDGGDLLQIKRYPATTSGTVPSDITIRWVLFHDVSRPAGSSAHPDGIQMMACQRCRILSIRMERVDVQGIFINAPDVTAGGGPITDVEVADSYVEKPPTGFYTVICGSESQGCTVRDTRVGSNVRLGVGCYPQSCQAIRMMDLAGNPIQGYIVG